MTRPLGARTRHGWLTAHALASGLSEQYAVNDRQAQLTCTPKPTPTYVVTYMDHDVITQTHTFTDLREAQARYTALVHKARRPSPERTAS